MNVAQNRVARIEYRLTGEGGELIESSVGAEPLSYLHGAGNLIPGLETALEGRVAGDKVSVSVPPDQAYGERDESLRRSVARTQLAALGEIEPGVQFEATTNRGTEILTVVSADDDMVVVDGNHPLAGQTLNFDVSVVDVRDATEEELAHGHAHGPHGHHHHDDGHDHG